LAGELAAETFASALGAAERYRPTGPTAAASLFTIAQNVLLKSARRGRVEDAARIRAGMALRLDLTDASKERGDEHVSREGRADTRIRAWRGYRRWRAAWLPVSDTDNERAGGTTAALLLEGFGCPAIAGWWRSRRDRLVFSTRLSH
jgi:hypothetical protein